MRVLEKTRALIARFLKEIEESRSFVELEELENVYEGDEGEMEEKKPSHLIHLDNESLKIEDFIDLMNGDQPISLAIKDVLDNTGKVGSNTDPGPNSAPKLDKILKVAESKGEDVFSTLVDNIFHEKAGDLKPEDDISVDYEEENKEMLIKSTTIKPKSPEKMGGFMDMSNIARIPLLSDDEDEEVSVSYRSLPKNVQRHNSKNFVMVPKYKKKKIGSSNFTLNVEYEIPDPDQFVALGYDSKNGKNKHYRYNLGVELENSVYMGARQFQNIQINRGRQVLGKESFLQRLLSGFNDPTFKNVGTFKGVVDIISKNDLDALNELGLEKEGIKINIPTQEETWKNITPLELDLMKKSYVMVRVYVIDAEIYDSYDIGSESDPYLKLTLGKSEINENNNFIDNKDCPKFLKMYELKTTFPGDSHLFVEIWDKDVIKSDELIGCTRIDIENRYYDSKWRELEHAPVETRKLYHPSSKQEKGVVRLWVEIFETMDTKTKSILKNEATGAFVELPRSAKLWDISPRPTTEVELRVVVWETTDVPMADIEDTVDIYVTCGLPAFAEISERKTDTHFRSQTGFVSDN